MNETLPDGRYFDGTYEWDKEGKDWTPLRAPSGMPTRPELHSLLRVVVKYEPLTPSTAPENESNEEDATVVPDSSEASHEVFSTEFIRKCATEEDYPGELPSRDDFNRWFANIRREDATPTIDAEFLTRQRKFSQETWPYQNVDGILEHLSQEMKEAQDKPSDVSEWADMMLLVQDGAMRAEHSPQSLINAVHSKFIKNTQRSWPSHDQQAPGRAIHHLSDNIRGRANLSHSESLELAKSLGLTSEELEDIARAGCKTSGEGDGSIGGSGGPVHPDYIAFAAGVVQRLSEVRGENKPVRSVHVDYVGLAKSLVKKSHDGAFADGKAGENEAFEYATYLINEYVGGYTVMSITDKEQKALSHAERWAEKLIRDDIPWARSPQIRDDFYAQYDTIQTLLETSRQALAGQMVTSVEDLRHLPTPTLLRLNRKAHHALGAEYAVLVKNARGTWLSDGRTNFSFDAPETADMLPAVVVHSGDKVQGMVEAIEFTGHNRDEILEKLRSWDASPYWINDEEFGTDNGFTRDESDLPVGEPAMKPNDWLIRRPDGIVLAYRPVTNGE